jgi:hypothetical protein
MGSGRNMYPLPSLMSALASESVFGKIHTLLASRLTMRRIIATWMKVSLVWAIRS